MSFLVAAIEHHARQLGRAVVRAIGEKCSGFSDYEAGDFLDDTCLFCGKPRTEKFCRPGVLHGGQDWADALTEFEAEEEVAEPDYVRYMAADKGGSYALTVPTNPEFISVQMPDGTLRTERYPQPPEASAADLERHQSRVSAIYEALHALTEPTLTQTPEAAQPGENPAGVTPPTPAGSPDPSRECECGHPRDEHGDGVVHTACCAMDKYPAPTGDVDHMCECPAYEPTDPSPTSPPAPQPSVGGEGSPLDSAIPPAPRGERPTWVDWAVPAICDVLAEHTALVPIGDALVHCGGLDGECHSHYGDWELWREHVAGAIAERLEAASKARFCINDGEPQTVTLNAFEFERYLDGWLNPGREHVTQFETGLDMGARIDGASEIFPQHRKSK